MSKRVRLHVGTLDDMSNRFVSAWRHLERGERVRERLVTFLADRLGRDYKRVHEDVETLASSGLIQREGGHVSVPYDGISAEMRL